MLAVKELHVHYGHVHALRRLLDTHGPSDWVHSDPWRVLRIQAEFVEGFGALAELGPAVSVFGPFPLRRHATVPLGFHRRVSRWPKGRLFQTPPFCERDPAPGEVAHVVRVTAEPVAPSGQFLVEIVEHEVA